MLNVSTSFYCISGILHLISREHRNPFFSLFSHFHYQGFIGARRGCAIVLFVCFVWEFVPWTRFQDTREVGCITNALGFALAHWYNSLWQIWLISVALALLSSPLTSLLRNWINLLFCNALYQRRSRCQFFFFSQTLNMISFFCKVSWKQLLNNYNPKHVHFICHMRPFRMDTELTFWRQWLHLVQLGRRCSKVLTQDNLVHGNSLRAAQSLNQATGNCP